MRCVRGRVGATRRAGVFGALALLVGTVALGACGSSPRSADDVLASAQAYVADASAFRFDASAEVTYVMLSSGTLEDGEWTNTTGDESGDQTEWPDAGAGTTTTDRMRASGSWSSEAWEVRSDSGYGRAEERVFGTTNYFRNEFDDGMTDWQMSEIDPWTHQDILDEVEAVQEASEESGADADLYAEVPGAAVGLASELYLGGESWGGSDLMTDPAGFLQAIEDMSDPEIASRDGATVTLDVVATAPDDIEEAWGSPLPEGRMTLTVGLDGAPIGLTLTVEDGDDSIKVKIGFSEWNVPVEIARPADAEIDRTPWLDEESIAAVQGIQLLSPTVLPEGWELDYVTVLTMDDTSESCDQVEMDWSPMVLDDDADMYENYLYVYLLPLECATASNPTPFELGDVAPFPSRQGEYSLEVLVGDTVVQVDSSLEGIELYDVLRSLVPTDIAAISVEMEANSSFLLDS